jgi:hypothetical protein
MEYLHSKGFEQMRACRVFKVLHDIGIPRHLDHRCTKSVGEAGNFSAPAVWKYTVYEHHIRVRRSQERKCRPHSVHRAYAVFQLQRGYQNVHDERVIFDDQNMATAGHSPLQANVGTHGPMGVHIDR